MDSQSGLLMHFRMYGTSMFTVLVCDKHGNMAQKVSEKQTSYGVDLSWSFCRKILPSSMAFVFSKESFASYNVTNA